MSDFDYGNARLHAMRARLLSRRALDELCQAGNVQALITALAQTPYRAAIQAALVRLSGMACLAEALRTDLPATLVRVRRFFARETNAGRAVELLLRRYDVLNVKAVLRGLAQEAPADEILDGTLPAGALEPSALAELARAPGPRAAIDILATWRVPLAAPLLAARAQNGGAWEFALEAWHARDALAGARALGAEGAALVAVLEIEADMANILSVLRLAGKPETARARDYLIGPGRVPFDVLVAAAGRPSPAEALGALDGTPYAATLAAARDAYLGAGRLSVVERALRAHALERAAQLYARDPLGSGVLVGYVALKVNETANLRAIAHGLALEQPPAEIRAELLHAEAA
jgi:vacuolar-type H+-ATPase subunit C/Vma6